MNKQMKANLLLLLTAAIWGMAFVAQKVGAEYVSAFTFNGIRFLLGAVSLLPIIAIRKKEQGTKDKSVFRNTIKAGLIAGIILFLASGLQQMGMSYTSASKAGFITGLYIVLVPVAGIFLKQKTGLNTWLGVFLALIGLYLLSINEGFTIEFGDFLVLCCAIAFTFHILVIDHATKIVDSIQLSCIQFFTCSALNLIIALVTEDFSSQQIDKAWIPILYGGLFSVGIAYTLQAVAQKDAKPSHAAILMSMESVFSCLGGMIILGERLSLRGAVGCVLIFAAIILSQVKFPGKRV